MEGSICKICGGTASSYHHIIYRSQNKNLIKSEANLVPLCTNCHRKLHSKEGQELDQQLKLELQNNLEILFIKRYITKGEIQEALKIHENALKRLLKTLKIYKEGYKREDVIRAIMEG